MSPELQQLMTEFERAIAGMGPQSMQAHPEGKWCVSEILEHLTLTYEATSAGLQRVLAKGSPVGRPRSAKQRLFQLVLLRLNFFPKGRQAPEFTRPRSRAPEDAVREFRDHLARMDDVLSSAEARWGRNLTVGEHPVVGPLSIVQWRKFHLAHARHHFKQIAVLAASGREARATAAR